ncbi:MAG: hypothetical protein Q8R82_08400 [Hyphomonadaceae bacterium]|nr:hypothetical protein [Hyphomonadaceae bacterium]
MPKREVDKRKTSKALRKLRRVAERAAEEGGPALTTWEKDFVEGVTGRLEKYGSAFRDPGKGRLEEALSQRQSQIARVIEKKTRKPKASAPAAPDGEKTPDAPRSSFKRNSAMRNKAKPGWKPRVRDINDDLEPSAPPEPAPQPVASPAAKRAMLKVIPGGKRS